MPHVQRADARRRVVLLVEDNVDAQDVYSKTLRHAGFDVVQARSQKEAHEAARELRPDVVVLDCRLPDGDGLELARGWRSDATMAKVPVIVLTAFSARQDMEAALLAGVDAFLVKPCPGQMLALQIEKVLSGQRPSQNLRTPVL
jgi:DNA-binding response OmpR family regulator